MKNFPKTLSILLLAAMLLAIVPLSALAAESYSFTGTVGEAEHFVFFNDSEDIVNETEHTGYVPGMHMSFPSDGQVALSGTPTQAGTYVLNVTVYTQRAGSYNIVLTVTIEEASGTGTPTVTKNPTDEQVIETDSATFIARADNTRQYAWELITTDGGTIACNDLPAIFTEMTVSGANTDTLTLHNIPLALNGCYVRCRFVGAEESVYSSYACILVTALEDVKPEITKHPTGETVTEGESAVFVAKAKYASEISWILTSPDGNTAYECRDAARYFDGLKASGSDTERLTLENIPLALNGWMVQCKFVGGAGSVVSNAAVITVEADPEKTEPTEETTEPTQDTTEPSEEATEAPVESPTDQTDSTDGGTGKRPSGRNDGAAAEENEKSGSNLLLLILIALAAAALGAGGAVVLVTVKNKGRG